MLDTNKCYCPYCGEHIEIVIDTSDLQNGAQQEYIEDCYVCCRPITVTLSVDDDNILLHVRSENE